MNDRRTFDGIPIAVPEARLNPTPEDVEHRDRSRSAEREGIPIPIQTKCDHGVTFDVEAADKEKLDADDVRSRWPRLYGLCPKGCGFSGIAYASTAHFVYGDW